MISLASGSQQVALVYNPRMSHPELLIASENPLHNDIDHFFHLLMQVLSIPEQDQAPETKEITVKNELVIHAFRMCRTQIKAILQQHIDLLRNVSATAIDNDGEGRSDSDMSDELAKGYATVASLVLLYENMAQDSNLNTGLVLRVHQYLVEVICFLTSSSKDYVYPLDEIIGEST